jgi:hypothetical protein
MQLACVFNLRERIRKMVEELGSGSPAERTSGSPRPGSEKVAAALAHIAGIRDQLAVVEHELHAERARLLERERIKASLKEYGFEVPPSRPIG